MAGSRVHLFVDNSNVLIEGRRLSYANRSNGGRRCQQVDDSYEIDWGKFVHLVKSRGDRLLAQLPRLYGSRPPPDDTVWQQIRNEGYDVKVFDRNSVDKEKGVDMEMGMDAIERLYHVGEPETMIIAAGDADFAGMIGRVKAKGWAVEVWFWSNAAHGMQNAATFVSLDPALDYLRKDGRTALAPRLA